METGRILYSQRGCLEHIYRRPDGAPTTILEDAGRDDGTVVVVYLPSVVLSLTARENSTKGNVRMNDDLLQSQPDASQESLVGKRHIRLLTP